MHRDRSAGMQNPHKRDARKEWGRVPANPHTDREEREHGSGKSQRTHGVREQEALHQIRELRTRSV